MSNIWGPEIIYKNYSASVGNDGICRREAIIMNGPKWQSTKYSNTTEYLARSHAEKKNASEK